MTEEATSRPTAWWLPPTYPDEVLSQRASVAWWTAGLLTCMNASLLLGAAMSGSLEFVPYLLVGTASVILALVGLKLHYVELSTRLLVALNVVMIFGIVPFTGGVSSGAIPFVAVAVVMGALLVGPLVGAGLTVAGVVLVGAMYVLEGTPYVTDVMMAGENAPFLVSFGSTLIIGVLVSFATWRMREAVLVGTRRADALASVNVSLNSARQYSETLLQSLAEPVLVTDLDGRVQQANDAAVSMLRAVEISALVGVSMSRLIGDEALASLAAQATPGQIVRGEARAETLASTEIPVAVSRSQAVAESGATRYVWVLSDITHRIEAQARSAAAARAAEDASRSKSNFLANMSHELRTPLNAVIGYSEMLLEDSEDPAAQQDLRKIRQAGQHLLALINDVLDMSKIEAGRMELHTEAVAIDPLLREVMGTVAPMVEARGSKLDWSVEDNLGVVIADGRRLQQILLNLLSNAAKFTENGHVAVTARRDLDGVTFSVADSGIGIAPDKVGLLFKPFTQADSSTSRKYGGTGLGLALSQKLAEMMGGRISVQSTHGVGSVFSLWLPARVRDGGHQLSDTAIAALTSGEGPLVLCIDDDPPTLELLSRSLHREGFRVLTAADGRAGLDLAKQARPAVITLDVMMPDMDGWSVLRHLKQDTATSNIPVVMVSMVDQKSAGLALGASDYLVKPVQGNQLVRVLRKHVPDGFGTVLVVDDEPDVRNLLRRALTAEGWTVIEAENSRRALELLEQVVPDAVVLDLMMPEMDGFEFVEVIRHDDRFADFPVIVLTAMDLTSDELARLKSRTEQVLQKGDGSLKRVVNEIRRFARPG